MEKHKLEIISMWYNEEILAPFFLNHYLEFADNIHLIIDADTNDNTFNILNDYKEKYNKKLTWEVFLFPDMMDDDIKVNKLNDVAKNSKYDWVAIVDADEFIFSDIKTLIDEIKEENLIFVNFFQVYRNEKETDLNSNILPIINQRRFGTSFIVINGQENSSLYNKPIVFRSNLNLKLLPGNHIFEGNKNVNVYHKFVNGTHWMMADIDLAIARRIYGRKNRQSKNNYKKGHTVQHWYVTEEDIKAECQNHLKDEQKF